jgi:hypothetical protein
MSREQMDTALNAYFVPPLRQATSKAPCYTLKHSGKAELIWLQQSAVAG